MVQRQTKVGNKAFEELPVFVAQVCHCSLDPLCTHCELWTVLSFHALLKRLTFVCFHLVLICGGMITVKTAMTMHSRFIRPSEIVNITLPLTSVSNVTRLFD